MLTSAVMLRPSYSDKKQSIIFVRQQILIRRADDRVGKARRPEGSRGMHQVGFLWVHK